MIGIGMIVIVLVVLYFFGIDLCVVFEGVLVLQGCQQQVQFVLIQYQGVLVNDVGVVFMCKVFGNIECMWMGVFNMQLYVQYELLKFVMFMNLMLIVCGIGQIVMGLFYCLGDCNVYIDFGFYDELCKCFGVGGDFVQVYVIVYEVGYYVQNLFGIVDKVDVVCWCLSQVCVNVLLVWMELQVDCFVGVWVNNVQCVNQWLMEFGDFEQGLKVVVVIGDDWLQQ